MKSLNKKIIVSVIMSMMMVLAMMPGMAFAADAATGSVDTVNVPVTLNAGSQTTVSATYTADGDAHIDWSVTNGTGSATINKHKGQLTAVSEGTVTVTATLVTGAQPSGGSGGQQGCGGTAIASKSATVTVDPAAAYGFQGEGGNKLKLTSPSDVTFTGMGQQINGLNVYNNSVEDVAVDDDGYLYFEYTMSAGINNFKEDTFNNYAEQTILLDSAGNQVGKYAEFDSFTSPNVKIRFADADTVLKEGETYTLQFGPNVCGNNKDKKLNCYLNFNFTL